ncbi:hypothetical protein [Mucilaginibacter jinjuensis]|uniref:MORN repeat protein n=1 Tax=Mucilaginibacter jinjuensis TaxID=1176721 RepID=A0ABY7T758_9SPHI|nr:hypothetical protein [Mucilaginibacter jinjuensis]WCT12109.1 hypothetical protein PQO05_25620 [Mucilaginibacter jinjuensis]
MKLIFTFLISLLSLTVFAQSPPGKYIQINNSNCLIFDYNYTTKDTVTWTGTCLSNYADGYGIATWKKNGQDSCKYTGYLKAGKPEGRGKLAYGDNYTLQGTFKNGRLQGKGLINDDGNVMKAQFVNNTLQGPGTMTFKTRLSMKGHFLDGQFINLDNQYLNRLAKVKSNLQNTEHIYSDVKKTDSLFYYTVLPEGSIKGVLVLLPSSGESVESVICNNKKLVEQASDQHIITILLSINNAAIDEDNLTLKFLNNTFQQVTDRYHLPKDKFIIGGLSGGGMLALRYTEIAKAGGNKTYIIPKAVFGADPPVDMAGLYNTSKRFITMNDGRANLSQGMMNGLAEAKWLANSFNKIYGGSPDQFPDEYIKHSMYSRSQVDGGNAKYLTDVPVRIYCDPDILWQMKERNRDYYDMNAVDQSAMINFLNIIGNKNASFIPALGKGYRLDGTRHPHSWSIVDAEGLVDWIGELVD